ncbi:MAG: Hpt domain-containing protein [Deltaproteobacteria bacterium]|nr:Hpt domain-containing protein [Deltaproteobacteria bacterium]
MGGIDKELLQTFVEEALEHVGDMEQDLLAIEENGARMDEDLINKVFRSAHTIKGNAGFVGLEQIATLAHRMEDVLGLIRKGQLIPNAENMNPLLLASDALKEMVSDPEANLKKDIRVQIEGLNAVVESAQASRVAASRPRGVQKGLDIPIPGGGRVTLNVSADSLSEASSTGETVYLIRVDGDTETGKNSTADRLKRYGEVLSVTEDKSADEKQAAYIVFACVLTAQDLAQLVNVNPDHLWILEADGQVRPIESTDKRSPTEDGLESFEIDSEEPDAVFEDDLSPLEDVPDPPPDRRDPAENAKPAAEPTPDAKVAPHPPSGSTCRFSTAL